MYKIENEIDDRPVKWQGACCVFCKHFNGIEKETCKAYPNGGIPDKFSFARDIHLEIEPNQIGNYIFTITEKQPK